MSIITKTGDQGITSLYSGERVPKSDPRIDAVGALDELSAHLAGLGLEHIQSALFTLGAAVADMRRTEEEVILTEELAELESKTYEIEATLPPLTNFILPGGHPLAIEAHKARAVCRRAERLVSELSTLPKNGLVYLNRLSDFLFVFARSINLKEGAKEVIWKSGK